MSVTRMFVSAAVISVILAFGTWQTARAFPLVQRSTNSGGSDAQRLGPGIVSPKAVKQVKAEYPPEAKKAKIQGTVVAEVRIDTDGLVQEPRVVKSIPQLDAAAIAAVRQWKFTPALKNGKPVPVLVDITIRFTLK